jgi:uncharacterized protein
MIDLQEVDVTGLLEEAKGRFILGAKSVHGPGHWKAVLANGMMLADALEGDRALVAVFALIHDCRRENEWRDPQHGERAAAVVRELNGRFYDFSKPRIAKLADAIHWHDAGKVSGDIDISCCWAADRIELRRVGIEPERWGFCEKSWPVALKILSPTSSARG